MDQSKLETFLLERRFAPFEWGRNDCCLFVADAVEAMHGVDFAANLRGYRTRFGAARRLAKAGGLAKLVDEMLAPISASLTRRGDVVMFNAEGGDALGLCVGRKFAAAGPSGVTFFDMSYVTRAWRCPQR